MANLPPTAPGSDPDQALHTALRQLRALPAAAPRPFFYGRVRQRLLETEQPALVWWLRRPAYLAAAFSLLLTLNAGAALHYLQHQAASTATTATTTAYDSFVTEYQLTPYEVAYE